LIPPLEWRLLPNTANWHCKLALQKKGRVANQQAVTNIDQHMGTARCENGEFNLSSL
jgi:hypothetical protein